MSYWLPIERLRQFFTNKSSRCFSNKNELCEDGRWPESDSSVQLISATMSLMSSIVMISFTQVWPCYVMKPLFRRASQRALRCATSLAMRNQMQPVLMDALFRTQQRFSGCIGKKAGWVIWLPDCGVETFEKRAQEICFYSCNMWALKDAPS